MMPTLKVVLFESKTLKGGKHPILIRVTFDRVPKYKSTGFSATPEEWDGTQIKATRPNAMLINRSLRTMLNDMESAFLKALEKGEKLTKARVGEIVDGKRAVSFYDFTEKLLKKDFISSHAAQTLRLYNTQLNKLKEFAPSLHWADITPEWLTNYRNWLVAEKNNHNNTQHKSFTFLKKVFNVAKVRGVWTGYPFAGVDLPKRKQTMRQYLTMDELQLMEKTIFKATDPSIQNVGLYFLFACYSSFRYSDVACVDLQKIISDNRLLITSVKTKGIISMPIHPKLKAVIDRLEIVGPCYANQVCNRWLKVIAVGAGVKKEVTFHVARHTFAVVHLELGGSMDVLQEILGHEDLRTTKIYGKITNRRIDQEMGNWEKL